LVDGILRAQTRYGQRITSGIVYYTTRSEKLVVEALDESNNAVSSEPLFLKKAR
jgi:hypothetical protein